VQVACFTVDIGPFTEVSVRMPVAGKL